LNNSTSKQDVPISRNSRVVHIPVKIHNKLKLHVAKKAVKGIKTSLGIEVASAIDFYLNKN